MGNSFRNLLILNVLSALVNFSTCESIRMSQRVDVTGQRTSDVVTKVDKNPEGLLEKVTANDVNIGLGYICVRNRVGKESHKEARIKEVKLFAAHPYHKWNYPILTFYGAHHQDLDNKIVSVLDL
ncbi:dynamin-related protein 4C-like protein [Tanacetum coccineum]